MTELSMHPDPWMRWIYDHRDPRYYEPETKELRDRRHAALRDCPSWMVEIAMENDMRNETTK